MTPVHVCAVCKKEIKNVEQPGIWEQALGWIPYREKGGANQIRVIRLNSIYAHDACIRKRKATGYRRSA